MTPTRGPSTALLVGAHTGSEYWRVWAPVQALQMQGYPVAWAPMHDAAADQIVTGVEVLVFCRATFPPAAWDWARADFARLQAVGTTVLYETDDDLFSEAAIPHLAIYAPEETPAAREAARQGRLFALRCCAGVTVTTEALAARVREYTEAPIVVVPNAIDWHRWRAQCARGPRPALGLTVGWAGGGRAVADLTPLAAAWRTIADAYPAVTFVVVGEQAPVLLRAVPRERLVQREWLPVAHYPGNYAGLDIGCAPLADLPFNYFKSPSKVLEYAAAGAAVVASPIVYGDVLTDGVHGLLAQTADEWVTALARLIEDAALRERLTAAWAAEVVARHTLAANVDRWPGAWQTLRTAAWARTGGA